MNKTLSYTLKNMRWARRRLIVQQIPHSRTSKLSSASKSLLYIRRLRRHQTTSSTHSFFSFNYLKFIQTVLCIGQRGFIRHIGSGSWNVGPSWRKAYNRRIIIPASITSARGMASTFRMVRSRGAWLTGFQ